MSNYKVGDKVVLTVTGMFDNGEYPYCMLNDNFILLEQSIDKYSEPLSTYTEPLEDTIQKYTVKIARLVMEKEELKDENERLKAENEKMSIKIDAYELCGDQHEVEYNQAFNQGAEAAWELARKIVDYVSDDGYSVEELVQIFGNRSSQFCIMNYTSPEAAAKVAEWEKPKEEIKVGDVVRFKNNNRVEFCVTDILDDSFLYGIDAEGGVFSGRNIELVEKTGRHIDIDSFLKQIGGEQE